jgi:hypothetical protein
MSITPHTLLGLLIVGTVLLSPLGLLWLAARIIRHGWKGR